MSVARWLRTAGTALAAGAGAAASVSLGLLVFGCVFLAVAGPRAGAGMRTAALQQALAQVPPLRRSVLATMEYTSFDSQFLGAPLHASDIRAAGIGLLGRLERQQVPLGPRRQDWSGLASGFTPVTGAGPRASNGGTTPQMEVIYRDPMAGHARIVSGRWPHAGHRTRTGAVVEVAVTRATAARFGLHPGMRLGIGPGTTLAVTGVIEPTAAGAAFWAADPGAATPSLIQHNSNLPGKWYGAAFASPAEVPLLVARFDVASMRLSWDVPLALRGVTADQARALHDSLAGSALAAGPLSGATITTGVSSILAGFIRRDQAVAVVLSMLATSLSIIGAVVILLGALLVTQRRDGEFALLAARGAARRQLALRTLRGTSVATVPAAVAAGALAVTLTRGDQAVLAWLLGGLTVLVALAGPPLIAGRGHRTARPGGGTRPDAAPARAVRARRLVAETALSAAAVGGLIVARGQGVTAGGGIDLYASTAPVLAAIPVAIIVVRCYPLVVRALLRLAVRRPGVTAFVGLARSARAPSSAVLPVFALVLALGVVAFGAMVGDAVHRGEVATSWQRTGADAVIDASGSARPLTMAVRRAVAAVPGARHVAPVHVTAGSTATGGALTVAVTDPPEYAAFTAATPGPPFPAAKLARPAAGAGGVRGPVPVLASRAAAAALRGASPRLGIGLATLTVRVAGRLTRVPGVRGPVVMLPSWALGARPPPPNLLLVAGPGLDGARLAALVHHDLPGATVTLRSSALAALTGAPLSRGADLAFAAGSAAAAWFAVLIVVTWLLTGAGSRELTLARLRVLGLSRRQAGWLVMIEALPPLLAAAAGGAGCAWLLAPLTGPALSLSSFTHSGRAVAIGAQPGPLAAAAGGLVLLALLTAAAQTVIAGTRPAARGSRAGD